MKAIVFNEFGEPEVLKIEQRRVPDIKDNEVLIEVCAAGVNRPDIFQRKGNYPAPKGAVQDILGLEVSGKVVQIGRNVTNVDIGDLVCALVSGGGYSEYVAVTSGCCLPIPKGYSLEDASSLPEVLFTVWHNLFQRGALKKGEEILIYGGSGGIGSMAIQLAALHGARVTALVSSAEKEKYCLALGAYRVVDYTKSKLLEVLPRKSIDVILDCVGGLYLNDNLNLLREEGRLVYINAMEGGTPELNIFKVMQKRLHITGSTLRSRSNEFKENLANSIKREAYPLLENEKFQNMVQYRFEMDQVIEAHKLMESRDFFGKIIVRFRYC